DGCARDRVQTRVRRRGERGLRGAANQRASRFSTSRRCYGSTQSMRENQTWLSTDASVRAVFIQATPNEWPPAQVISGNAAISLAFDVSSWTPQLASTEVPHEVPSGFHRTPLGSISSNASCEPG